ncbi:hypothetical protein [Leuconostoc palmae]|uniref:hypothetical protein n=1 Tax=Leuconostoc palmae TaxID=501487 RepID=UPI001C7D1996|nr:hypothetical protein [Leuconostoc palmae]
MSIEKNFNNKSYLKGFKDGTIEKHIYDDNRKHFLRIFFYQLGKKVQDSLRSYDKKNTEYMAGHRDGLKS